MLGVVQTTARNNEGCGEVTGLIGADEVYKTRGPHEDCYVYLGC